MMHLFCAHTNVQSMVQSVSMLPLIPISPSHPHTIVLSICCNPIPIIQSSTVICPLLLSVILLLDGTILVVLCFWPHFVRRTVAMRWWMCGSGCLCGDSNDTLFLFLCYSLIFMLPSCLRTTILSPSFCPIHMLPPHSHTTVRFCNTLLVLIVLFVGNTLVVFCLW